MIPTLSCIWQPLWQYLPPHVKTKATECAERIWLIHGDAESQSVTLSYVASPDGSAEAIVLNLLEKYPDTGAWKAHYVVDIVRRRIKISWSGIEYASIPDECMPVVEELEAWVHAFLSERQEKKRMVLQEQEEERAQKLREQDEERANKRREQEKQDAKAYEERLAATIGRKRKRTARRVYARGSCQACGTKLVPCAKCQIVSCPVDDCKGRGKDDLRTCDIHMERWYCGGCRSGSDWRKQWLASCPSCDKTLCIDDLVWCAGTAKDVDRPVHKAKVLGCKACIDESPVGRVCCNQGCKRRTSSLPELRTCSDCAKDGVRCPNHRSEWWCSSCKHMAIRKCPTCKQWVCPRDIYSQCPCGKIDSCRPCRDGAGWESDGHESESDDSAKGEVVAGIQTFDTSGCNGCPSDMRCCGRCINLMDIRNCEGCDNQYCNDCLESADCIYCGKVTGCGHCLKKDDGSRRCPKCEAPSLTED